jgi:hypothetical protein
MEPVDYVISVCALAGAVWIARGLWRLGVFLLTGVIS